MSEKALIIDEDPGVLALLRFGLEQDDFTAVTGEMDERHSEPSPRRDQPHRIDIEP
jgi:hypothetical protein